MKNIISKKDINYLAGINVAKENNIDVLKRIVEGNSYEDVKFNKGGKIRVDLQTANALMVVYNALSSSSAKEKFERMVNNSKADFIRVVDFVWSKVR
jgi:hypothetical protein